MISDYISFILLLFHGSFDSWLLWQSFVPPSPLGSLLELNIEGSAFDSMGNNCYVTINTKRWFLRSAHGRLWKQDFGDVVLLAASYILRGPIIGGPKIEKPQQISMKSENRTSFAFKTENRENLQNRTWVYTSKYIARKWGSGSLYFPQLQPEYIYKVQWQK